MVCRLAGQLTPELSGIVRCGPAEGDPCKIQNPQRTRHPAAGGSKMRPPCAGQRPVDSQDRQAVPRILRQIKSQSGVSWVRKRVRGVIHTVKETNLSIMYSNLTNV